MRQKVVRPLDRRAQRALPALCVAAAAKQIEPLAEPLDELARREQRRARRREFERERQVVEPLATLVDVVIRLEVRPGCPRSGDEQVPGVASRENRHLVDLLPRDAQPLTARHEHIEPVARREQFAYVGGRADDVLEVVEQKQQPPVPDQLRGRSAPAERARRRGEHLAGARDRGEWDPPHAMRVGIRGRAGGLQRKPRLTAAAGSGQRQHPHVVATEQRLQIVELTHSAEERCCGYREVRPVQALQRRERGVAELVEPLGRRQILQTVLPEIAQSVVAGEVTGRLRDQHLSAVSDRGDARGAVDVEPHVTLVRDDRLTRVHAHAHADRSGSERLLSCGGGCERVGRSSKRDEECVALRVDLDSVVRGEHLPECASVLAECVGVRRPELVQQFCRPFDVGEEERDGAGRERAHRVNYARI